MGLRIHGSVPDLDARGVLFKKIVVLPVRRWSDRPGNKSSTAVRTDVLKHAVDTRGAERALIGANARFQRVRRKRLIAVLTGWSELQHKTPFSTTANSRSEGLVFEVRD